MVQFCHLIIGVTSVWEALNTTVTAEISATSAPVYTELLASRKRQVLRWINGETVPETCYKEDKELVCVESP